MNNASTHSVNDKKGEHQPCRPPLKVFLDFFLPYPYSLFLLSGILTAILFSSSDLSVLGLEKALGALFQCIATGYIAWVVIYSYLTLGKNIQTFANLIADAPKEINPNKWVL